MLSVAAKQKHIGELAETNPERSFENIYRVICEETWLTEAWMQIRQNKGSKTAGVDGQTKNDVDETLIKRLAEKLQKGEYKPTPVRRVYIPKGNGKLRPLGIPTIQDRIVQNALKMFLEPIYEQKFSNCSHGFRPRRSCMTALADVARRFQRSTWIIEGDIKGCFDNINHGRLLAILRKTIRDEKVIGLIASFLAAGYLEQWSFHRTYSGTPQGGIISPLLANIYLTEMDKFLEETLKANIKETQRERMTRKTRKGVSIGNRLNKLRSWLTLGKKWGRWETRERGIPLTADMRQEFIAEIKTLEKEQRNTPSLEFRKSIGFIRYADDYLVILQKHSKAEAEEVKEKIGEFLKTHLKLEQNEEKTLISHPTDTMKFLGYHLTSQGGRGKTLRLLIPKKAIDGVLAETERLCAMHHIPEADLITKVNALLRGWMNYYRFATTPQRTFSDICYKVFWQVGHYLAAKHKTSIPTILRKYTRNVTWNGRTKHTFTTWVEKKPFDLWLFPPHSGHIYHLGNGRPGDDTKPQKHQEWATGRSIENRIATLEAANYQCENCGTIEDVQVHHIGGLRGLHTAKQLHMAGDAKEKIALCRTCHVEIGHHGSFKPRTQDINVA
jgi:RNA-directed DNA polymerase